MKKLKEQFNDVIAPIKYLDGKIARSYTKLTKKWEDKGHNKYSLAFAALAPVWLTENLYGINPITTFPLSLIKGYDSVMNITGLMFGSHPKGYKENGDKLIVDNLPAFYAEKFKKFLRLPFLTYGTILFINSGINLYTSISNGDLNEIINNFAQAYSCLGISSSIYIQNSDPKLLEKQPMWKDALDLAKKGYEGLADKVGGLLPQPVPANNYSLEDRI